MVADRRAQRRANRLLCALPAEAYKRLEPSLRTVTLKLRAALMEPGESVQAVYFPIDGVVSLVNPLEDGAMVEVATIGNEGLVGVPFVLGGAPDGVAPVRAVTQVGGTAVRLDAKIFADEVRAHGPLSALVQTYVQALFGQISQAAACNRLHSTEERLARWLLMSHDRVGRDDFPVTQEFLAQMLGSRRATVTLSAGILQSAGLIRYKRGYLTIVDRERLEAASCECYGVVRDQLDQVVPRALQTASWE